MFGAAKSTVGVASRIINNETLLLIERFIGNTWVKTRVSYVLSIGTDEYNFCGEI